MNDNVKEIWWDEVIPLEEDKAVPLKVKKLTKREIRNAISLDRNFRAYGFRKIYNSLKFKKNRKLRRNNVKN